MTAFRTEMLLDDPGAPILVPCGLDSPQSRATGLDVTGGTIECWTEPQTGQPLAIVTPARGR